MYESYSAGHHIWLVSYVIIIIIIIIITITITIIIITITTIIITIIMMIIKIPFFNNNHIQSVLPKLNSNLGIFQNRCPYQAGLGMCVVTLH